MLIFDKYTSMKLYEVKDILSYTEQDLIDNVLSNETPIFYIDNSFGQKTNIEYTLAVLNKLVEFGFVKKIEDTQSTPIGNTKRTHNLPKIMYATAKPFVLKIPITQDGHTYSKLIDLPETRLVAQFMYYVLEPRKIANFWTVNT